MEGATSSVRRCVRRICYYLVDSILHLALSAVARGCLRCFLAGLGSIRFGYVDTTFEICPVFDDDARSLDVAHDGGAGAERDSLLGLHVSTHRTEHDHLFGFDIGVYFTLRSDG